MALGLFYLAANIQPLFTSISKNSYQLSNVKCRKKRPFSVSPQDSCKVLFMSLRKDLKPLLPLFPFPKIRIQSRFYGCKDPRTLCSSLIRAAMPIQSPLSFYNKNDGQAVALTVFFHCPSTSQICLGRQFCCWLRLALVHWIMKASLLKVNQFTRNCFRVVGLVSKNNFFAIKIERPTPLHSLSSLSYLLWFLGAVHLGPASSTRTYPDILKEGFYSPFSKKCISISTRRVFELFTIIHTKMPKEWDDG